MKRISHPKFQVGNIVRLFFEDDVWGIVREIITNSGGNFFYKIYWGGGKEKDLMTFAPDLPHSEEFLERVI